MSTPTNSPDRQPRTILRGGRVIDSSGERFADVVLSGAVIERIGGDVVAEPTDRVIELAGKVVAPGFVDLHTHLREPGKEEAETVQSGARAAALGGYTAVVAMPNTTPCMDDVATIEFVRNAARDAACEVVCSAAITVGRDGTSLAEMARLAEAGVRIFTDDGSGVQDDRLMRRALEYSRGLGVTLAQHCEVSSLSEGTCMNEGDWSSRLGLAGQPREAEELMVMRDIALVRLTGARMHFLHLSTAGSVAMVRAAKAAGLPITAEAAPHHFTLTDECCAGYDPIFKVHPPLRTDMDVEAVKEGLADGTIDAIATDHAPHTSESKELPFAQAPPGMLGLEYAFALANTELGLGLAQVLKLLGDNPAQIAEISGNHGGPLAAGRPANLVVLDPDLVWEIDASGGASKSRNVPYVGRSVRGKVLHTFSYGLQVVGDSVLLEAPGEKPSHV